MPASRTRLAEKVLESECAVEVGGSELGRNSCTGWGQAPAILANPSHCTAPRNAQIFYHHTHKPGLHIQALV